MQELLTPEQASKLEALLQQREERRENRGPGRKRDPRGNRRG